jgi:hypothetical protein
MIRGRTFVFLTLIVFGCFNSSAQSDSVNLDSLVSQIQFLIGDSWYVDSTENGIDVTYCRSCGERYLDYLETTDPYEAILDRGDFFTNNLLDSVCYFTTISQLPVPTMRSEKKRIEYYTKRYLPNDILRFTITFDRKWSQQKLDSILLNNELLKDKILEEPVYKTSMDMFSDYRFCVPNGGNNWKKRTQEFDFYFERLPYSSLTIDASIFVEHNKLGFFSIPILVDRRDETFFDKPENKLEDERQRVLKIIALALGIYDYSIVY